MQWLVLIFISNVYHLFFAFLMQELNILRQKNLHRIDFRTNISSIGVNYMWLLMWKRTLRLSIRTLKNRSLAVCDPFVIRSWSMECRSNGLDHPFRKNASCSNSCCYPFKKNLHLFKRLRLSVWKKSSSVQTAEAIHSKKIVIHSSSWGYPFKKTSSSVRTAEVLRSNKIFIRLKKMVIHSKK